MPLSFGEWGEIVVGKQDAVWMSIGRWVGVLIVVSAVAACGGGGSGTSSSASASTASKRTAHLSTGRATSAGAARSRFSTGATGSALAALAALPVKGRAPMTGYTREQFGDGWLTVSGCDTRDRMLRRDLTRKSYVEAGDCEVAEGHLNDPYTDAAITFVRGGASEVDIDHVVALGDAWQKGAQQWSRGRRVALANDPLNLLSVDASANRQKGDGDAATWLPSNRAFRCRYVARQIAVKGKYQAWVTQAEHNAMARVLSTCPRQRLPTNGRVRVRVIPTQKASTTPSTPNRPKATPAPATEGRVFANCAAVRAAGLAPLRRGTADYEANPNLDRDEDGLACE